MSLSADLFFFAFTFRTENSSQFTSQSFTRARRSDYLEEPVRPFLCVPLSLFKVAIVQ